MKPKNGKKEWRRSFRRRKFLRNKVFLEIAEKNMKVPSTRFEPRTLAPRRVGVTVIPRGQLPGFVESIGGLGVYKACSTCWVGVGLGAWLDGPWVGGMA